MSRSEAEADLHLAFTVLTERWNETRSLWRDSIALEFEQHFWSEVSQNTRNLERSAEALNAVLEQALRRTES
jgi:hypothetical protein